LDSKAIEYIVELFEVFPLIARLDLAQVGIVNKDLDILSNAIDKYKPVHLKKIDVDGNIGVTHTSQEFLRLKDLVKSISGGRLQYTPPLTPEEIEHRKKQEELLEKKIAENILNYNTKPHPYSYSCHETPNSQDSTYWSGDISSTVKQQQ
jgi:hypothetical protein